MKTAILLLLMPGHAAIDTGAQALLGYFCEPRVMVDGLPVYDCVNRHRICVVDIMDEDGSVYTTRHPCIQIRNGWQLKPDLEGVINIRP